MDESTFLARMLHAEIMHDADGRPDYWHGYIRGLQRAFHGEKFGTAEEHALWLSLGDQDSDAGLGYRDALVAVFVSD